MSYEPERISIGIMPTSSGVICDSNHVDKTINNLILHNTLDDDNVQMYYNDGSGNYQIYNIVITENETVVIDYIEDGLVLPSGSFILGQAEASGVSYVFSGQTQ